jgi:hypothetical protein
MKNIFLVTLSTFALALPSWANTQATKRTSKENAIPGARFQVKEQIKSVTFVGSQRLDFLSLYGSPGGFFDGGSKAFPGNILEVLVKPKRYDGINAIKVRNLASGHEGFVYWTEFYHSTVPVTECDQALTGDGT